MQIGVRGRLAILSFGNFAVGTGALVIGGILPPVAEDLDVSISTGGQLVTVYALTYALTAPPLASLAGRWSRRRLLLGALALFAAGNIVAALAPSFAVLMLGRLVAAVGGALFTPTSSAIAAAAAPPEQRARALAFVFAGLPVSTVLGVPLGTFAADVSSWRVSFLLVVALATLAAIAVAAGIRDIAAPAPVGWDTWRALLGSGAFVSGVAVTWLQASAQFAVFTYVAALLVEQAGLDGRAISGLLLLGGVAAVAGVSLGGAVGDRWPPARAIAASVLVLAVALAALPALAVTVLGAALALVVWNLVGWAFNPIQQQRLVTLAPQAPGPALAMHASALYLGSATGAVAGALAVTLVGVRSVGPLGALIALAALLPLWASVLLANRREVALSGGVSPGSRRGRGR